MAYGDTLLAVYRTVGFAWFFLQQGMVQEADSMLCLYDCYDGRPYPIYYGTKGENHLAHGRLDSAEYCFRKELEAADGGMWLSGRAMRARCRWRHVRQCRCVADRVRMKQRSGSVSRR